jgi:hypothetical protein
VQYAQYSVHVVTIFTTGLLSYCLGQGLVSTIVGIPSVYQHFLGELHMKVNLIVNFNPMWDKNDNFFFFQAALRHLPCHSITLGLQDLVA